MVQKFKEENSRCEDSDKDMNECCVLSEMPQICFEISFCLCHVLRTFGRKITAEKMGIILGESNTIGIGSGILLTHTMKKITFASTQTSVRQFQL